MALKITVTLTRPDTTIPFYIDSDEAKTNPQSENLSEALIGLILSGAIDAIDYSYPDDLTLVTTLVIHDLAAYKTAFALGDDADALDATIIAPASVEYNTNNNITVDVTTETL